MGEGSRHSRPAVAGRTRERVTSLCKHFIYTPRLAPKDNLTDCSLEVKVFIQTSRAMVLGGLGPLGLLITPTLLIFASVLSLAQFKVHLGSVIQSARRHVIG